MLAGRGGLVKEMMTLEEKRVLVTRFIGKCNEYADRELARYRKELSAASGSQALAIQDKICHWTAYRAFNGYTVEELHAGKLDDWLA